MRALTLTIVILAALSLAPGRSQPLAQPAVRQAAKLPPLLPREREVSLALSAAPAHVAEVAGVFALERNGYVKVRDSRNGFNCLVERQVPEALEPECFDAEGSETTLAVTLREGDLRAQGKSRAEIEAEINAGYAGGKYRAPRRPGVVFMLSSENVVLLDPESGKVGHFGPHLMFYAPYLTNKDIGSRMGADDHVFIIDEGSPRALMIVPVHVSDSGQPHH